MPIGERLLLRRCRYSSEDPRAGRLCLATGIHGDEMIGQLIVFQVAQRLMAQGEHLHGMVDIYPMLNPTGLDVSERTVPTSNHLDMNRSFPGKANGTALEALCHAAYTDMLGADLVLDIHASTQSKSELYEVRISGGNASALLHEARALCPDLIWLYPDRSAFGGMLTSALRAAGTKAMVLEADECRRSMESVERIVDGIFCKMHEMGMWSGEVRPIPQGDIPCIRTTEDSCRVACLAPGMFVPRDLIGQYVKEGDELGVVIDALSGDVRERVLAPRSGLVFSARSYSAVYPGTLIARLYTPEKEGSPA